MSDIKSLMQDMGARAKEAASSLAFATAKAKAEALEKAAEALWATRADVLDANQEDMAYGREKNLSPAMLDRLLLTEERIEAICAGLRAIAAQNDPVGEVIEEWDQPSGLHIQRVRTPIGVIGVIYESRPNVTADAGALCLKSGNAVILRGGSESFHSSAAIHKALQEGLKSAGLPVDAIQLVPLRDREAVGEMLTMQGMIDVIIPRGGKGLVGRVQAEARVPVFAHLEGICHVYIDASADIDMATKVLLNAKTRRTGICGSAECVLVHKDLLKSDKFAPIEALLNAGVEVRGDQALQSIKGVVPASPEDYGKEFLDMIIAAKTVANGDEAIAHITQYGSQHTDSIIAQDMAVVNAFFQRLESAILMHNTSTQFADGGEFGMGAEIGIATGKMHARGPVGAKQLTSFKYLVSGNGTIRP